MTQSYTDKHPSSFTLFNRTHFVSGWRSLLHELLEDLFAYYGPQCESLIGVIPMEGDKEIVFNKPYPRKSIKLSNGYIFPMDYKEEEYAINCKEVCVIYGITPFDMTVEYEELIDADQTAPADEYQTSERPGVSIEAPSSIVDNEEVNDTDVDNISNNKFNNILDNISDAAAATDAANSADTVKATKDNEGNGNNDDNNNNDDNHDNNHIDNTSSIETTPVAKDKPESHKSSRKSSKKKSKTPALSIPAASITPPDIKHSNFVSKTEETWLKLLLENDINTPDDTNYTLAPVDEDAPSLTWDEIIEDLKNDKQAVIAAKMIKKAGVNPPDTFNFRGIKNNGLIGGEALFVWFNEKVVYLHKRQKYSKGYFLDHDFEHVILDDPKELIKIFNEIEMREHLERFLEEHIQEVMDE